jgi:4a-hydroxytetrahydrobiopterin dehydratase
MGKVYFYISRKITLNPFEEGRDPMRLSEEEIETKLKQLNGWKRPDEKWIEKRYRFREFMKGIHFVNQVANIAEEMNHHPLISIDYKLVTLRLTSWNARGLTDLDFQSAQLYDEAYKHFIGEEKD